MRRLGAFLLLLALGLHVHSRSAEFIEELPLQGCLNMVTTLEGRDIRVDFNGTRMFFYTRESENGRYDTTSYMVFQWTSVVEYSRVGRIPSVSTDTIAATQDLSKCRCTIDYIDHVVGQVHETGWEVTLDQCGSAQPNLVAKAFVTVPNDTYVDTHGPTSLHSTAPYFNYTHPAGGIKFGFAMNNWKWSTEAQHVDNSFLAGGYQFGFNSPKRLGIVQELSNVTYVLNLLFGKAQFVMTMELGYLLDDIPTVTSGLEQEFPATFEDGTFGLLAVNWPIAFPTAYDTFPIGPIPPLAPYSKLYYDPSLQVIFGNQLDKPTTAPNSPAKKSEKRVWVVGLAVGLPLAILFVISIILIVMFVPAVRSVVMPYYKLKRRNQGAAVRADDDAPPSSSASSSSTSASSDDPAWIPATKPI